MNHFQDACWLYPLMDHQHPDPEDATKFINHCEVVLRLILAAYESLHHCIQAPLSCW